jgi:hypothetical protein
MRAVSIPLLLLACLASTSVLAQNMGQNKEMSKKTHA